MTLLELAKERFGKLEKTEKKLFSDIEDRGQADFCDDWAKLDPSTADLPELRAECVAWLLTDRKAGKLINHRGVTVVGARLTGVLDASFARFPSGFCLLGCYVPGGVVARYSSFGLLGLVGSHVAELNADGMQVLGNLFLSGGFSSQREVRLLGTTIGGDLQCSRGSFRNEGGNGLTADGMRVSGNAFLDEGFVSHGEVRLLGSFIGGDFDCGGGTIRNAAGYALSTNRMKVSGAFFLNKGFSAEGEVCLVGSTIGGKLECGGTFRNAGGDALNLETVTVSGAVSCRNMTVEGCVKIENSSLHRKLHLDDNTWETDSSLSLIGTSVNVLCDGDGAWPAKGNLCLNGFIYEAIHDGATMDVADRLAWLDLQPDDEYRPQPYEQLAAVYARNGYGSHARKVLVAKNKRLAEFYRRDMAAGLRHLFRLSGDAQSLRFGFLPGLWHHVLGLVVGYGYRPQRLLYIALGMVAVGWLLFGWGSGQGAMVPALAGAQECPRFQPLVYSLDTFLPLVDLEQKSRWVPDSRVAWSVGSLLGGYQVLHILMGWFLTTMGVAALIDRLKR